MKNIVFSNDTFSTRESVCLDQWFPKCGAHPAGGEGVLLLKASYLYEGCIYFEEIWAQCKIYILVSTLLG
jgi:hypothetical protein